MADSQKSFNSDEIDALFGLTTDTQESSGKWFIYAYRTVLKRLARDHIVTQYGVWQTDKAVVVKNVLSLFKEGFSKKQVFLEKIYFMNLPDTSIWRSEVEPLFKV